MSLTAPTPTSPVDGRKYTLRYYNLITNVGGLIGISILRKELPDADKLKQNHKTKRGLADFLTAYKDDIEDYYYVRNKRPKRLSKKQLGKLFPGGRAATSARNFDITLSMFLMGAFIVRDKKLFWSELDDIDSKDKTQIADLARIRCYRNKLHDITDTATSLSENDFWEYCTELTKIFLRLGESYHIPEVFKRINKELHDPLDGERENELDRKIQAVLDDLRDSKETDETFQMLQNIDKELAETRKDVKDVKNLTLQAHCQEEVKDVIPKEYFEKTKQYHEAKQALLAHKIIVLNGAPGEGKTTMAKKLVTEVSKVSCIKVTSRVDWKNISSNVDAVLIDDMFGAGIFDKEECRKWQKLMPHVAEWVKNSEHSRYVVITSRSYILQEAKTKMFLDNLFTEQNVYTLLSQELVPKEKLSILEKQFKRSMNKLNKNEEHFSSKNKDHDDVLRKISDSEQKEPGTAFMVGFPECARLFANNENMYKKGEEFFVTPMVHIKKCVSDICKKDDDAFVAFFVLWAQEGRTVRSRDLEKPIEETSSDLKDPILKLQYHPNDHLRKMREKLYYHVHHAGLITLDSEEQFRFSHNVVRDAVGLIAFDRNKTATLSLCDEDFIKTCIYTPSESLEPNLRNQTEEQSTVGIQLQKSRFDQVSWRIAKLVIPPTFPAHEESKEHFLKHYSIFTCALFENEDFCRAFLEANRTKNLETLLKTPVRRIDKEFKQFKFKYLKQVDTKVRLPSFLLWYNEKVSFLAEQCFSEMKKYPTELQEELFIALLATSANGSYEQAEFLVETEGQINSQMILIALDRFEKQRGVTDHTNAPKPQSDLERLVDFLQTKAILPDPDGYFPIHLAALEGRLDLVQTILDKDSSQAQKPHSSDKTRLKDASLYHIAAFKENKDLVDLLLRKNVPANVVDGENRTPLLYAIYHGKSRIAHTLLEVAKETGEAMRSDSTGNTPLHIAIKKSVKQEEKSSKKVFKDIALVLCKENEKFIHLKNVKGESPLFIACTFSAREVITELLKRVPKEPEFCKNEQTLMHDLIKTDKKDAIEILLSYNFDHNLTDRQNRSPLQLAEEMGKMTIANLLRLQSKDSKASSAPATSVPDIENQEIDTNS